MTPRPRIGITGSRRRGRIMTFLNRVAVRRAGGSAVVLRPGDEVPIDHLDGLVIGGGDDIDASLYEGEIALDVRLDPERDRLELLALEVARRRGIPVLGICRGSQLMNVFYGGSLHAEVRTVFRDARHIRTVLPKKRVRTEPGTRLAAILGSDECHVNSLHHQAVDRLGQGFVAAAEDEHGMIQAIEAEAPQAGFLIGVQWHPEFLFWQARQQRLFRELVTAAWSAKMAGGGLAPAA